MKKALTPKKTFLFSRLLYGDDDVHLLPPLLTTASIFLPQADVFFLIPLAQYAKRPRLRAHARNLVGRWGGAAF